MDKNVQTGLFFSDGGRHFAGNTWTWQAYKIQNITDSLYLNTKISHSFQSNHYIKLSILSNILVINQLVYTSNL